MLCLGCFHEFLGNGAIQFSFLFAGEAGKVFFNGFRVAAFHRARQCTNGAILQDMLRVAADEGR